LIGPKIPVYQLTLLSENSLLKMVTTRQLLGSLLSVFTLVASQDLYVSHYSGYVARICLQWGSAGNVTLTQGDTLYTCGGDSRLPAWITFDSSTRIIYCTDENWTGNGSLTTISAPESGPLKQIANVTTPISGVHNTLYGNGKFAAVAH
jgi:hypothetical protein